MRIRNLASLSKQALQQYGPMSNRDQGVHEREILIIRWAFLFANTGTLAGAVIVSWLPKAARKPRQIQV